MCIENAKSNRLKFLFLRVDSQEEIKRTILFYILKINSNKHKFFKFHKINIQNVLFIT